MAWIENINFDSEDFHLRLDRWDFPDQGISCILGESGSGKTTLLQIIAGLLPSQLRLSVRGELLSELAPGRRNIGFVFQDYALFPHLSAEENIIFAAEAKKLPRELIAPHLEKLIARLSLERVRGVRAQFLSGGESQRVALARALVTKPQLVCLDEPFSSLDETRRDEARDLVAELALEFQVPFVMVTHDLKDARRLSEAVLLLREGRVVGEGKTKDILNHPATLEIAQGIAENQFLKVSLKNNEVFLAQHKILTVPEKRIGLKPEYEAVISAKSWSFIIKGPATASSLLAGELLRVSDEGSHLLCRIKLSDAQTLRAMAPLVLLNSLKIGQHFEIDVEENSLTLF